ncbi:MAG: GerAB/ArcD/ProY family transporter [Clostridia bacterium]|nr:GerAB/ArcD/ProY family transporter [Clostridia bacterium]
MLDKNKDISVWQTGIVMFVLMFANKIMVFPTTIKTDAKYEVFLVYLTLFAFEMGLLFLFWRVKLRHPNEDFFDIVKHNCGKFFCTAISILICLYFFSKSVLLYNILHMFLRSVMYRKGAGVLFLVCILPVVNFLAQAGLRPMARTMQFFFPFIFLTFVLCLVIGSLERGDGIILYSLPFGKFASDVFRHICAFGDSIVLFLFMNKINVKKKQFKTIFILTFLGMLITFGVCVVFILSYTYTAFLHPFAIFEMLSYIKEYEGLGRLDIIPAILVMFLSIFQLGVYFKCITLSIENVFPKVDGKDVLVVINILFVLIVTFLIPNLSTTIWYAENVLPFFAVVPFLLVPSSFIFWRRVQ